MRLLKRFQCRPDLRLSLIHIFIINGRKIPNAAGLVEKLKDISGMTSITLNVNTKRNNVILGNEILSLWGKDYITDYIGEVKYQISPLSFYQVNPVQTEKLYGTALELSLIHIFST